MNDHKELKEYATEQLAKGLEYCPEITAEEILELLTENESLRKDAERYRWMRSQTEEYAEMYFGFADPAITDQAIDDAMNKDGGDD